MKFKILIFFLLVSIKATCQLERMFNFYSEKLNEKNEDKSFEIFKIKGKVYKINNDDYFSTNKTIIYKNKTSDIVNFMIYKKRYLFVGYFPNTEQNRMRAVPSERWALDILEIIDLDDNSKKWIYHFDNMTAMRNIKSFDPKDGKIVYSNNIFPEINDAK